MTMCYANLWLLYLPYLCVSVCLQLSEIGVELGFILDDLLSSDLNKLIQQAGDNQMEAVRHRAAVSRALQTFPGQSLSRTDVSRTRSFPDSHFPGQDVSQTRSFPDKTFPGKTFPGQLILRIFMYIMCVNTSSIG